MRADALSAFEPQKTPVQARSAVTVEAISEATVQVLLSHGGHRLTTTLVTLHLANVTFVDREAMMFLCSAKSPNITVENCPSYVIRWIQREGLCRNYGFEPPGNTSSK